MRRMSTRVWLLLAVLAAAGAAFWLRPSPSVAAAPTEPPLLQWVATAHQLGIVGYRDPAVADLARRTAGGLLRRAGAARGRRLAAASRSPRRSAAARCAT